MNSRFVRQEAFQFFFNVFYLGHGADLFQNLANSDCDVAIQFSLDSFWSHFRRPGRLDCPFFVRIATLQLEVVSECDDDEDLVAICSLFQTGTLQSEEKLEKCQPEKGGAAS